LKGTEVEDKAISKIVNVRNNLAHSTGITEEIFLTNWKEIEDAMSLLGLNLKPLRKILKESPPAQVKK
jgi:hypothetical protein